MNLAIPSPSGSGDLDRRALAAYRELESSAEVLGLSILCDQTSEGWRISYAVAGLTGVLAEHSELADAARDAASVIRAVALEEDRVPRSGRE